MSISCLWQLTIIIPIMHQCQPTFSMTHFYYFLPICPLTCDNFSARNYTARAVNTDTGAAAVAAAADYECDGL